MRWRRRATRAEDAGAAAELVVAQLGHGDYAVTRASYTTSEAPAKRKQERALQVLRGGKR